MDRWFLVHIQPKRERLLLSNKFDNVAEVALQEYHDEEFRRQVDEQKDKMRDPAYWRDKYKKWYRWFNILKWRLKCG